jgi:hypothetical protein
MDQERAYLDLLRVADQFELADGVLTLSAESKPILVFEIQSDEPVSVEPTSEPEESVSVHLVPSPTAPPVFEPPEGFTPYQDPVTGITIYIPKDWIVTGIIAGEYAILQSYPEGKYIGGKGREEGDTKCDLRIRSEGNQTEDLLAQWQSNAMTTIVSEEEFSFQSGSIGQRFIIDSMGRATVFITEINQRVVLLTCFGDFWLVDEIAATLNVSEQGKKELKFSIGMTLIWSSSPAWSAGPASPGWWKNSFQSKLIQNTPSLENVGRVFIVLLPETSVCMGWIL